MLEPAPAPSRAARLWTALIAAGWAFLLGVAPGWAAPGDVLYTEDFESGLGAWAPGDPNLSGVNAMAAGSPSQSLYTRGEAVTTTGPVIDTRVPAIRIEAWVRRGSDAFSETTDSGEDFVIEYLDSGGAWVTVASYLGSGTPGEILSLDTVIAGRALHSGFRLRVRQIRGSGGPPENRGIGWDYWHVDDFVVSESEPPQGLGIGRCEEFESGLGSWTVSGPIGRAMVGSQTANSPTRSLAINGGEVEVRSQTVDLAFASGLELSLWIRRGSDAFSEDPDSGEDLYVEFLDDAGSWITLGRLRGDGTPGQIFEPRRALPTSAAHSGFQLRLRMTGNDGIRWDYWHVDSICLSGQTVVGEWRFEESVWNGTPGEIEDSSGGGHDGSIYGDPLPALASPALSGNPGTCGYGDFDGTSDAILIPHADALDGSDALTYTAWIRPRSWSGTRQVMAKSVHGGGSGRAQMGIFAENGRFVARAETVSGREEVRAALPAVNSWSHVAAVFGGDRLALYVDGVEVASDAFAATTLVRNGDPLAIGKRVGTDQYFFDGDIDEVRVYGAALDATRIGEIMAERHPCPVAGAGFTIEHDGTAVHCQPETITVRATDAGGNLITGYTGTISLDTGTGGGSWSLATGDGVFADPGPDDGLASYEFVASDAGEASFALFYTTGPLSVDVDVGDGTGVDDDSEGPLLFSPSAFTLTANALPTPPPAVIDDPIPPRTAGSVFDVHLAAYGTAACGIIESYQGDKALRFWVDHDDPSPAPVVPSVDGQPIARSEATASDLTVTFVQGQAHVAVRYKDVGRIVLGVADPVGGPAATPLRGRTNAFVSRPADLTVVAVVDASGSPNPGAQVPAGALFARAGEPFGVVVEARDAEGDLTPSFGRERSPEGLRLRSATLVAPAGGRNGVADLGLIANATAFEATAPDGTFAGTSFAFDEVGAIRLQASVADGDYLGSGDVLGSASAVVGRFAPSRFEVSANLPRFATACALGAFTWLGQPFSFASGEEATLVVTAVNANGDTTANYAGDWWRLTNDSLAPRVYAAGAVAIDASGLPDPGVDPAITPGGDGTGTLRFSTGSGLMLDRSVPLAPFDAEIELAIGIRDLDDTLYPLNPFTVGGTSPGTGIAFDVSKRFQLGRLRFSNAHGSELVALPMPLHTQRFDGSVFVDDDSDSCSRVPAGALSLSPSPGTLATTPTVLHDPLLAGRSGLRLSAPGVEGLVDVVVDLGPGGAALPWLRSDWPHDGNLDGALDDDPRARATFGIWSGRDSLIYVREVY